MENLMDIDVIILNKFAAWSEVDQVWDKYYDLDVETKSFIQLFKHIGDLQEYYDKLVRFYEQKVRTHRQLIQILKETSGHITGAMVVFSSKGDNYLFNEHGLTDRLYQ